MKICLKLIISVVLIVTFAYGLGAYQTKRCDVEDDETLYIRRLDFDYELWSREFQAQDVDVSGLVRRAKKHCYFCGPQAGTIDENEQLCENHRQHCSSCVSLGKSPVEKVPSGSFFCKKCSDLLPAVRKFTCPGCTKDFYGTENLLEHLRGGIFCEGTDKDIWICPIRGHVYEQRESFITHVEDCEKHTGLAPIDEVVLSKQSHTQKTRSGNIKCGNCGQEIAKIKSFNEHMESKHYRKSYVCPICFNGYSRKPVMLKHLRSHH